MRLGKYKRDADSVQREGENLQAVWSPDSKLIAVLVSYSFFFFLKIDFASLLVKLYLFLLD